MEPSVGSSLGLGIQRVGNPEGTDSFTICAVLRDLDSKLLEGLEPVLNTLVLEIREAGVDSSTVTMCAAVVFNPELLRQCGIRRSKSFAL